MAAKQAQYDVLCMRPVVHGAQLQFYPHYVAEDYAPHMCCIHGKYIANAHAVAVVRLLQVAALMTYAP